MIPVLSLVTSVKDYLEVVHKLIEYDSINMNYTELGTILTYFLISVKTCVVDFFSLSWLKNIWSLPVIMPEISSAMISEISVLDGYFHNAFNFLETPVSYGLIEGPQNSLLYGLEKFTIGLLNSLFLFLPTSTAQMILLRRFVMQGLDAGYAAGLGTIAGNVLWLTCVIFGWRFFVIPWLSLDIFRYLLGFVLLIKYMWDSYNEQKAGPSSAGLDDLSKRKFFLLNFLLALTEQTSIYPFISNLSISPETSLLESFPADTHEQFIFIHLAYLLGITLGCFSLLNFTCWFWENPAFKIYMWVISSFQAGKATSFYKYINFTFLYLTMISAISSIPYYGLDYTITNPLGYVNDDRIIQDKLVLETSFLGGKASDRNTRRNRGRHGRRERWKRRIRKYRTFDASLYDQGIYDLFTIESLNYGFDRFWLRRKLRNHRVRFRFFPGPWMRTFKKQLAKPRLESYTGPRSEFFRILFEQVYHPSFHAYESKTKSLPLLNAGQNIKSSVVGKGKDALELMIKTKNQNQLASQNALFLNTQNDFSIYSRLDSTHGSLLNTSSSNLTQQRKQNYKTKSYTVKQNLINENSTLRKFVRKLDTRLKTYELVASNGAAFPYIEEARTGKKLFEKIQASPKATNDMFKSAKVYSKQWKHLFSKIYAHKSPDDLSKSQNSLKNTVVSSLFGTSSSKATGFVFKQPGALYNEPGLDMRDLEGLSHFTPLQTSVNSRYMNDSVKKQNVRKNLSKKDFQILRYRSLLSAPSDAVIDNNMKVPASLKEGFLLHPLKFYLQREAAFKRKLRYYGPSLFRKFSVENNAPYFRVMMRRYFYNYKPSLRWQHTMKVASLRKARRKTTRITRKLQMNGTGLIEGNRQFGNGQPSRNDKAGIIEKTKQTNETPEAREAREASILMASKRLQKPTYNYSVVSKKASRYRYQIYKDVLQHWYYSPFNRLLLKLDVDSFMGRQPKAHFLTAKEENLLHLRRFLISEHYNTLRWYTNMSHYRSMKTRLGGGAKSFSSGAYNQQFAGTFKKIRHLFAITPSQGQENVVLKFDQPLYNEAANNAKNPLLNQLIIHEELADVAPRGVRASSPTALKGQSSVDLLSLSQNIVGQYLANSRAAREQYIKNLLKEKNYTKLTQFLYNGQKTRVSTSDNNTGGEKQQQNASVIMHNSTTNQRSLNNQEKDALLTQDEKNKIDQQLKSMKLRNFMMQNNLMEDLYVTYLKKWKRKMNDQEALKNYLSQRVEKREKRKQKKEKHLLNKLKRLELWFNNGNSDLSGRSGSSMKGTSVTINTLAENDVLTTGLQKAIFEGMSTIKNVPETTGKAHSFWKVLLLNKCKNTKYALASTLASLPAERVTNDHAPASALMPVHQAQPVAQMKSLNYKSLSLRFNDLKTTQQITLAKDITRSTEQLRNLLVIIGKNKSNNSAKMKAFGLTSIIQNKLNYMHKYFTSTIPSYLGLSASLKKITNLLKPIKRKSLKYWRQKERASGKQKRSRKEFKMLNKKVESKEFKFAVPLQKTEFLDQLTVPGFNDNFSKAAYGSQSRNGIEFALQNSVAGGSLDPARKKRDMQASSSTLSFASNDHNTGRAGSDQAKGPLSNNEGSIVRSLDLFSRKGNIWNGFKRKRSPQRRARVRRNRGVFKKRTLSDSLKKDIKNFYKNNKSSDKTRLLTTDVKQLDGGSPSSTVIRSLTFMSAKGCEASTHPFGHFPFDQREKTMGTWQPEADKNVYALTNTLKEPLASSNTTITSNAYNAPLKQRKSKQRKQRVWKQKRSKFSQKRRKYRKRKRYALGHITVLSKQLKRVKNKIEIQNWWWKQFVPSIQASTDALWQIEKDKLIQQKLSELSSADILERDQMFNSSILQIGNKDFKPLSVPEAIRLKDTIIKNQNRQPLISGSSTNTGMADNLALTVSNSNMSLGNSQKPAQGQTRLLTPDASQLDSQVNIKNNESSNFDVVNKLYENLFIPANGLQNNESYIHISPNTMLPFYAGWDESLRKFVVTNRMLSRRDAGFEMKKDLHTRDLAHNSITSNFNVAHKNVITYDQAPVQGMNAATTLYWQIPFTTYDPDQFFALGMDGFSPIGWRKFLFRHSILKTWLNTIGCFATAVPSFPYREESRSGSAALDTQKLSKTYVPNAAQFTRNGNCEGSICSTGQQLKESLQKTLIVTSKTSLINTLSALRYNSPLFKRKNISFDSKNASRRLKKRYRRVKKHPRTPVWFPSGPLLNQVLPVHYIYVFYKRSRLPRDRYLKRRLLNTKTINNSEGLNTLKSFDRVLLSQMPLDGYEPYVNYDFTLRKRLKPKRKYHLKRDFYESNVVIPRRFKFISTKQQTAASCGQLPINCDLSAASNPLRWRPLSSLKINKPIVEIVKEQKFLRSKQRRKDATSKQSASRTPLLRVKQLRRRVQRQVLRSVWRYRPRSGGFVWPGDYLKLELVKAPKLQMPNTQNLTNVKNNVLNLRDATNVNTTSDARIRTNVSKTKRKKKRTLVEWQIQPKKYLYEKHNIKVLKKKLEKSFRSDKLHQKIKELNYKI
uniref:Uncharacterized protein/ potential TIC214 n=1 Tax=Hyalogonium fusiforme TaxID=2926373 RepID=A0A9E7V7C6_9CHLO|nr:uncharacterized protein/ potential TIC214 [Hyalogonium fusiforme]